MKLICPHCGGGADLDQMTQAVDLLGLSRAMAAFGDDWPLVSEYLDGFRTALDRPLKVKKRLRLAREVYLIFKSGRFQLGGQTYEVGLPELREALAGVGNRELTGLKNHNYLKQVLKAAARATSMRQEREFKEREGRLRSGGSPSPQPSPPRGEGVIAVGEVLAEVLGPAADPGWRKEFSRLNQEILRARNIPEEKARLRRELDAHLAKRPQPGAAVPQKKGE